MSDTLLFILNVSFAAVVATILVEQIKMFRKL